MHTDLQAIAKSLRALDRRDLAAWFKRGELLTQARALCVQDREFSAFLRETHTAKVFAYRLMLCWSAFGSVPNRHRFTRSAMEMLAKCEAARNEALQLAADSRINARIARSLLCKHDPTAKTPVSKRDDLLQIIIGDGFKVTIRTLTPVTPGDTSGILMTAARMIREQASALRAA